MFCVCARACVCAQGSHGMKGHGSGRPDVVKLISLLVFFAQFFTVDYWAGERGSAIPC